MSRVILSVYDLKDAFLVAGLLKGNRLHLVFAGDDNEFAAVSLKGRKVYDTTPKEELIVEPEGRAYLKLERVQNGIAVSIQRMSNDGNIFFQVIEGKAGTISFDPWDRV